MRESYPLPANTHEGSDDDSFPESSSSKKKKGAARTKALGELSATTVFEAPKEIKKAERAESIWQRLGLAEAKKAEEPGEAKREPKAEDAGGGRDSRAKPDAETAAAKPENRPETEADDAPEVPLEELSPAETRDAVTSYVDAKKEELAAAVALDEPEAAAENAANAALLDYIEEKLAEDPEKPVAETLDEAEAEVVQRINMEEIPEGLDDEHESADEELAGSEEAAESPVEVTADDEDVLVYSAAAGGSGTPPVGGGGSGSSGGSGFGGSSGSSGSGATGSSSGSGGAVPPLGPPFGGGVPPYGPRSPGAPLAPAGPNFNAIPAAPAVMVEQDITAERAALARGVLVGGIVGYLIGRRRGRIRTEKRLMPVQKKLEKEVTNLHESVAAKEQAIRKLAAEKSRSLPTAAEKTRFAASLAGVRAEAASERVISGNREIERPRQPEGAPDAARTERVEKPAAAGRFRGGRIEAPAVVLGAAAALRNEQLPGKAPETAPVAKPPIDFTKKVESYTARELTSAAENIKIDGTTLKELSEARGLDEKAVRRVVKEFVEGGNVKEALQKEVVEKELQFERDPQIRRAASGSHGGDGAGGGSAATGAVAGSGTDNSSGSAADGQGADAVGSGKRPVPDKATLERVRRQQIAQVAGLTTVLVILVAILVSLLT